MCLELQNLEFARPSQKNILEDYLYVNVSPFRYVNWLWSLLFVLTFETFGTKVCYLIQCLFYYSSAWTIVSRARLSTVTVFFSPGTRSFSCWLLSLSEVTAHRHRCWRRLSCKDHGNGRSTSFTIYWRKIRKYQLQTHEKNVMSSTLIWCDHHANKQFKIHYKQAFIIHISVLIIKIVILH